MIHVPHSGPEGAPILVVGESPGDLETDFRQPFVGPSGELLRKLLYDNGFPCASTIEIEATKRNVGIEGAREVNQRFAVRFANLVNFQPPGNDFQKFTDSDVTAGVSHLKEYIGKYKDRIKVIIPVGNYPLQYLLGKYGISNWRGSILQKDGIYYIPTFHPANILRNKRNYPILNFDIGRAFKIFKQGFSYPNYDFTINPTGFELEDCIHEIKTAGRATVDIESVKNTNRILCVGFGLSNNRAICVPNTATVGLDSNIRRCLAETVEAGLKQTYHNGLYDIEIMHNNGVEIPLEDFEHDTMVMQHVLEPEMEKSLSFITSIHTEIPYYKDKGKMTIPDDEKGWSDTKTLDRMTLYEYNCLDDVATLQCRDSMWAELQENEDKLFIYKQEMSMHEVAFDLMRNGMLIDKERNLLLKSVVEKKFLRDQQLLNYVAGHPVSAQSWQQKQKLLYGEWELPIKTNKDSKTSTDDDAITALIGYTKGQLLDKVTEKGREPWQKKLVGLLTIQKLQGYAKLIGSYLDVDYHEDGRIRSVYKITGTETGRWSCSKYYDDTGWNAQTLPREYIDVSD